MVFKQMSDSWVKIVLFISLFPSSSTVLKTYSGASHSLCTKVCTQLSHVLGEHCRMRPIQKYSGLSWTVDYVVARSASIVVVAMPAIFPNILFIRIFALWPQVKLFHFVIEKNSCNILEKLGMASGHPVNALGIYFQFFYSFPSIS
jgi:hypothetical protein